MSTANRVKATTADGKEVEFNAADLRFSLGQALDEDTFRKRYAQQGVNAPNVITLKDLSRLKLQHKLRAMQQSRASHHHHRDQARPQQQEVPATEPSAAATVPPQGHGDGEQPSSAT